MLKNKMNGKIYIGQTFRPIQTRLEEHRTGKSSGCVAIYNAIKFHGWENFDKDWYECPDEDLNFDEELLVREMGTLSPDGYNLKEGGGGGKMSMESKQKMSEAQRGEKSHMYGKNHTNETIQKMSKSHLGKTMSEESVQKMSEAKRGENNPMFGKTMGEDTKNKISETERGKRVSEETKKKISEAQLGEKNNMFGKLGEKNPTSRRVYQYDIDGTFINSFGSCEEAARHLEKNDGSSICRCARGKQNTAYGFKWSYVKI